MTAQSEQRGPVLTWPGKSREICRDAPPLTVRALFGSGGGGWPDMLAHAENRQLLSTLNSAPLRDAVASAGGIKLVYIDPPFAVGADFRAEAGGVSALAYRDIWQGGMAAFLSMMFERLLLIRELLAEDGSIYVHCDYRTEAYMRLLLEEAFGRGRFLGSIIWHYTGGGRARRWFSRKHDTIFHFARSKTWHFNADAVRVPYKPTSGYAKGGIVSAAGKRYMPHPDGTPVDDVWDIPMVNPLAAERTGYPTQKPEALLERILLASSRPGDLVADFFCGSGTTAVAARRLGRRFLCADSSALAVQTALCRLLALPEKAPPFVLAALGETGPPRDEEGQGVFRHVAYLSGGPVRYTVSDIAVRVETAEKGVRLELQGFSVAVEDAPAAPVRAARPNKAGSGGADSGAPATLPGELSAELSRELSGVSPGGLPGLWTDWLVSWAVGMPCDDGDMPGGMQGGASAGPWCNRVIWHSRRDGGESALCTGELARPARPGYASPGSVFIVTIADIFANVCRVRVTV